MNKCQFCVSYITNLFCIRLIIQALSHSYTSSYSCVCRICFILIGGSSKYVYKWENHFYEMKGDVGMSLHEKKGTRRCLHQDTKSLITPSLHLCFTLTCCLFVCYECIRQSKQHNILTSNCLHENVRCSLGRNKDVGMGL